MDMERKRLQTADVPESVRTFQARFLCLGPR
jgi:hypothetical protein